MSLDLEDLCWLVIKSAPLKCISINLAIILSVIIVYAVNVKHFMFMLIVVFLLRHFLTSDLKSGRTTR